MALSTWIDQHLEEFVRPTLGEIPAINHQDHEVQRFTPLHLKTLVAIWEQAKRRSKGRPILLPGRDVWLLNVIAEMQRYPVEYRQDLSSIICNYPKLIGKDYSNHYVVDTGYAGTVPKRLNTPYWDLIRWNTAFPHIPNYKAPGDPYHQSWYHKYYLAYAKLRQEHQLFPWASTRGIVDQLAGMLETTPKYFTRADVIAPNNIAIMKVSQHIDVSKLVTIAAIITRLVAEFVRPKTRGLYLVTSVGRFL